MPKRKASKEIQPEDESEYEPEQIVASEIDPQTLNARFRVKWKGYDSSENTWEPLDNIYKCPMLLQAFADKKKAALKRSVRGKSSEDAVKTMPHFSKIPQDIVNRFRDPEEFIPTGSEEVVKFGRERLSEAGNFLWMTFFKNNPYPVFIRKCVAAYYWPFEACLKLTHQVHENAKIKRAIERAECAEKSSQNQ